MSAADERRSVDPKKDQRNRTQGDKDTHAAGQEPQQDGDNGYLALLRSPWSEMIIGSIYHMSAAVAEFGLAPGADEFNEPERKADGDQRHGERQAGVIVHNGNTQGAGASFIEQYGEIDHQIARPHHGAAKGDADHEIEGFGGDAGGARYDATVAVRRYLSEFRDHSLSRHPLLLKMATGSLKAVRAIRR